VTLVEIDKAVSDMAEKYFKSGLNNTFQNPRFKCLYQDALTFFPTTEKYNFIALDLNDPTEEFMHSHPLYSGDFYNSCKSSLEDDGIMVVQIGCPHLFTKHFKHNVELLKKQFKYVAIYGQYMRCYGTYQYFAACSDNIDLLHPDVKFIDNQINKFGISNLKLYNTNMHKAMLMHNNEIIDILEY
jgi:spermidine synthase